MKEIAARLAECALKTDTEALLPRRLLYEQRFCCDILSVIFMAETVNTFPDCLFARLFDKERLTSPRTIGTCCRGVSHLLLMNGWPRFVHGSSRDISLGIS